MLTEKGRVVLEAIQNSFEKEYAEKHPGCYEVDCERAFLHMIREAFVSSSEASPRVLGVLDQALKLEIETIR